MTQHTDVERDIDLAEELQLAFAPLHKRAFGIAIGVTLAIVMAGMTIVNVIVQPEHGPNLELLDSYFFGYDVSWLGVFVGAFWAFIVGFVGGWFVAFCRNLIIAASIFITRTRAELGATRDFLDHI